MKSQGRILVVDDCPATVRLLGRLLERDYQVDVAVSGEQCCGKLSSFEPELIILDVNLPGVDGIEACRLLKAGPLGAFTQVLLLSSSQDTGTRLRGYEAGADDYLTKPFDHLELQAKVRIQFRLREMQLQVWRLNSQLLSDNAGLERLVQERTERYLAMQDAIVLSLVDLVEKRDNESGEHLLRMQAYSEILAQKLMQIGSFQASIDESFVRNLRRASVLHDIGKVGIPDAILQKPGKLTPVEYAQMQRHVSIGAEILERAAKRVRSEDVFLQMAVDVVRYHHERYDGSGYCEGLRGESIPLAARIVAVADVYDALTSERCYKEAFSPQAARELIVIEAGKHFDPHVVDAFLQCIDQIEHVRQQINAGPRLDKSALQNIEAQPSLAMNFSQRSATATV